MLKEMLNDYENCMRAIGDYEEIIGFKRHMKDYNDSQLKNEMLESIKYRYEMHFENGNIYHLLDEDNPEGTPSDQWRKEVMSLAYFIQKYIDEYRH